LTRFDLILKQCCIDWNQFLVVGLRSEQLYFKTCLTFWWLILPPPEAPNPSLPGPGSARRLLNSPGGYQGAPYVAALWFGKFCKKHQRIGHRPFLGSGRPRGTGKPFRKVGGEAPPPFARVSGVPGAAQTTKMTDFQSLTIFLNQAKVQPRILLTSGIGPEIGLPGRISAGF
jgi:hypothetical protein